MRHRSIALIADGGTEVVTAIKSSRSEPSKSFALGLSLFAESPDGSTSRRVLITFHVPYAHNSSESSDFWKSRGKSSPNIYCKQCFNVHGGARTENEQERKRERNTNEDGGGKYFNPAMYKQVETFETMCCGCAG